VDWIGYKLNIRIGLDWFNKNGPMSNSGADRDVFARGFPEAVLHSVLDLSGTGDQLITSPTPFIGVTPPNCETETG